MLYGGFENLEVKLIFWFELVDVYDGGGCFFVGVVLLVGGV